MKKEKGFTLIELLAVIVILAVLMVVAVPKILNVIENSRKSAAESSIKLVKDAIKTQVASGNMMGTNFTSDENNCYIFNFDDQTSGNVKELNVKNKEKIKGTIKYCNGTFSEDTLVFDGITTNTEDKKDGKIICKRASTLHTEECTQKDSTLYCSGAGYTESGSKGTTTITYGNLGSTGTISSGDAFDCDVNGDGVYDEKTERFYYVSDYYNTNTKEFENDTAVLIYYNNVSKGEPSTNATYEYDSSGENFHGPRTAIEQLPTISQWNKIELKNSTREILNENGGNTTTGGTLPSNFSYAGYSARLLTFQEVKKGTGINIPTWQVGELDNFTYLLENTKFSNDKNNVWVWWLENARSGNSTYAWSVLGSHRRVSYNTVSNAGDYGVRPVIEVPKSNIEY